MKIEEVIKIVLETDKIFFDKKLSSDVSEKGQFDYVTRADIEISNFLHKRLKEEYPDTGFFSEEEKESEKGDKYWILDPIDGTTNFMHGLSMSAISLGYCADGEVVAGIIYIPYTKELFWAEKGKGAFLNGKQIYCTKNAELFDCLGILELNAYFKNDVKSALSHSEKIYLNCQDIRTFGSVAVDLAYIACGRADVFLGRYLKPWDFAAGMIIISEAGGKLSGLSAEADINELNQHIVATNGYVHQKFLKLFEVE